MSNSNLSLVRRRKQSLAEWIREAMSDSEKDGTISAIALCHMNGTIEREIDSVKFGGRVWKEDDLAARFEGKAHAYAQDLPEDQTFCLFAFYAGRSNAEASHPFTVKGDQGINAGLGTYSPDPKGEKMQGMAFSQAMVQLSYRQTAILFEAQQRFIENMSRREEKLLADNQELFELAKEMILKAADREHEHRMAELKFLADADTKKKLLAMAPALANQFTGKEIFPQATEDTAIVEGLLDKLIEAPEGALPMLLTQLGVAAQDQAAIMMRARKYAEKKAQAAEDAKLMVARMPEAEEEEVK